MLGGRSSGDGSGYDGDDNNDDDEEEEVPWDACVL